MIKKDHEANAASEYLFGRGQYYDPKTGVYDETFEAVSIFYCPFTDEAYYDPFKEAYLKKYETPLDEELGIVDNEKTIDLVRGLVPPDFFWGRKKRRHHWQHDENKYRGDREEGKPNLKVFRNLPINMQWLPLQMERTIHATTNEPPVPDDWVVEALNNYFKAARELHASAHEILEWRKLARIRRVQAANPEWAARVLRPDQNGKDIVGKAVLKRVGRRHSSDFASRLADFKEIPPEQRIVDTNAPPERVIHDLGRILVPKSLALEPVNKAA